MTIPHDHAHSLGSVRETLALRSDKHVYLNETFGCFLMLPTAVERSSENDAREALGGLG